MKARFTPMTTTTSRTAYDKLQPALNDRERTTLTWLRALPAGTDASGAEADAALGGEGHVSWHHRLGDLWRKGEAVLVGTRSCRVTGSLVQVYRARRDDEERVVVEQSKAPSRKKLQEFVRVLGDMEMAECPPIYWEVKAWLEHRAGLDVDTTTDVADLMPEWFGG